MQDRIGTLHLNHRVRRGATLGRALVPAIDRAVQAGLADALSRRVKAMMGEDLAVIVIRELHTSVALGSTDARLDGQVVEQVSRSAADAVAELLAREVSPDKVMRFADQTEFVGSFIAELIEGTAWARWYFGAFERHRHADTVAALRAVLEDCGAGAARVFGWLSQRGQLDAVLALMSPHEARRLCGSTADAAVPHEDGMQALIEAARRLLGAIDPGLVEPSWFDARVARFLATAPIPVDWTGTRGPSARVAELMRWIAGDASRVDALREPAAAASLRGLLAGPLDWLDARWLASELIGNGDANGTPAPRRHNVRRHLLTPRQDRLLERIASALRERRVRLPSSRQADADEIVVRLIAAAALEATDADALPDRSIVAVIEHAVRAAVALRTAPAEASRAAIDEASRSIDAQSAAPRIEEAAAASMAALRYAGPAALQLLRHVAEALQPPALPGVSTNAAGIFLLARAIDDVRLPALGLRFGIETGPLLGALATEWISDAVDPDEALALWTGRDIEAIDRDGIGTLDVDALHKLNDALTDLLIDRGGLRAEAAGTESPAPDADKPTDAAAQLARTARLLVRGWARWLPGVSDASASFLLDRCVRRAGSLRIEKDRVLVRLEPAPLDVVLKMAGYLARIDCVRWLGDRAVEFEIDAGTP